MWLPEMCIRDRMWRQNRMSVSRFRSILIMDLLQLPLTLLFTRFMNLFSTVLPDLTADCSFLGSVAGRLLALLTAVVCTGVGAVLILDMRLIANPGDGIVQVLADFFNAEVGLTKNCFDAGNLLVSISLGLFLSGRLTGCLLYTSSCCKKAEGTTRLPVGKSPVQPATPAFTSRSTPYFRQRISALMAALTFPTPPAQAMISGSISKKGTPESVSKGSQISGRARSSDGMANCSPILMETPH